MEELIKKRGRGRPKKTEKETAVEVKENLSRAREEFYAVAGGLGVGIGQMIKFIAEKKGIGYDDSEFWRERWANNTQILAGTFVGGGLKYLPHLNFLMAFVLPFYAQAGQVLKTSPRVLFLLLLPKKKKLKNLCRKPWKKNLSWFHFLKNNESESCYCRKTRHRKNNIGD